MEHEIRNESGVAIIDLSGEIDVSHAPKLRETLFELIESNAGRLLVNLSDVVYIDSAGLSVLIAAHRKAQDANGILGLSSPQQPLQQIFNITGVYKAIHIFPTVEEGISALSNA